MVLKRLDDAVQAGDPIRAFIRSTGVNQDGRTSGITLPNQEAQESLIRSTYQRIRINPRDVGYVEAHGTGTTAGDATEMSSIANVFCNGCQRQTPLYVGSIKANIGHLESSSGIAGLIKSVLILEKGCIPPNVNLRNVKHELKLQERKIEVSDIADVIA